MAKELIWDKVISGLSDKPIEIQTIPSNNRQPLWFSAYLESGNIIVENARLHTPSIRVSKLRKIGKDVFLKVYPFYSRWANGEKHLRQEVREISWNTAYIFALINNFE
jgi:hypothetical protein